MYIMYFKSYCLDFDFWEWIFGDNLYYPEREAKYFFDNFKF